MRKIFKKHLSLLLALIMTASVFALPHAAYAGEYTETVEAFTYGAFEIPEYTGELSVELNGNKPSFTSSELTQTIYETYGELDSLGRVTVCEANIDKTLMPTESRTDISAVKPTGWIQNKYDFVDGKNLYNRSHLIGFQLTGENANKNNLMTGTRSFNAVGMLKYENAVANYVKAKSTNNVLYRVTPVFQGSNLLASGVIMEAESVDDLGASVSFCVFVYNVENGVSIDYATGDNFAGVGKTDISKSFIYLTSLNITYTGKEIKPLEYVEVGGKRLTAGKDFTVRYKNNVKIGTAKVTVTGKFPYYGSASKSFKIVKPKPRYPTISKLKATANGFTVSWKKVSDISGYQIQYSTNKSFKGAKSLTVNSKSAKSKAVKKLKSAKVYYVRIRSYKTVNKTKYYSKWSYYKSVKTK